MALLFGPGWTRRTVVEVQVLSTGLFITGILARVIFILGFDDRAILSTPFSISSDVLNFLLFVVGSMIFIKIILQTSQTDPIRRQCRRVSDSHMS